MIELHNADCLEAMRLMEDDAFDLAIVDPPYGIGAAGKMGGSNLGNVGDYKEKDWDDSIPSSEYFQELKRVSKNQVIWGGNYFLDYLGSTRCFIVWDKNRTGNYADGEIAWTSFDQNLTIFKHTWNGMIQENMKNKEWRIHPTQKPVALYTWLLEKYTKKGDRILDTHLGSGSIAIAAHNLGYDLTGYELDPDYYSAACKRLTQHQKQLRMF